MLISTFNLIDARCFKPIPPPDASLKQGTLIVSHNPRSLLFYYSKQGQSGFFDHANEKGRDSVAFPKEGLEESPF